MQSKWNIDETFTDIADTISAAMGKWQLVLFFLFAIFTWTIYCILTQGPAWWYGAYYNLPLNLATTVIELFCECFILAAANRVERRNIALLEKIERLAEKIEVQESQEIAALTEIEQGLGVEASE